MMLVNSYSGTYVLTYLCTTKIVWFGEQSKPHSKFVNLLFIRGGQHSKRDQICTPPLPKYTIVFVGGKVVYWVATSPGHTASDLLGYIDRCSLCFKPTTV